MDKLCEECGEAEATKGERYCKPCRKVVLGRLRESGYLTPCPWSPGSWSGKHRSSEQRENVRETKYGPDQR